MIRAVFTHRRLTVQGHAGAAPKGQDIVCAAVTALVYALAGALEETGNLREAVFRPGYATVAANEDDAAFTVVRCGLTQLAGKYGPYVSVE